MNEAKRAHVTELARAAYPGVYTEGITCNDIAVTDEGGASLRVFLKRARDEEAALHEAGVLEAAPEDSTWPLFHGCFKYNHNATVS